MVAVLMQRNPSWRDAKPMYEYSRTASENILRLYLELGELRVSWQSPRAAGQLSEFNCGI